MSPTRATAVVGDLGASAYALRAMLLELVDDDGHVRPDVPRGVVEAALAAAAALGELDAQVDAWVRSPVAKGVS